MINNLPANSGGTIQGLIPGLGRFPGKEMETYSSILAWRILWTEESGRLQFLGLQESDKT